MRVCVCAGCTRFWLLLKAKSHLYSFEINLAFIQGARREQRPQETQHQQQEEAKVKAARQAQAVAVAGVGAGAKQWINTCTWHTFRHNTRDEPRTLRVLPPSSLIDKQLTGPIETTTSRGALRVAGSRARGDLSPLILTN